MVSEYRALRASVIRLWMETCATLRKADIVDMKGDRLTATIQKR